MTIIVVATRSRRGVLVIPPVASVQVMSPIGDKLPLPKNLKNREINPLLLLRWLGNDSMNWNHSQFSEEQCGLKMTDVSYALLVQSIRRDLTPAERDQLTPDALMQFAVRNTLTDSERAKLSTDQLMQLSVRQTLSLADRDRLSPDQLMQFAVRNTLQASERKKLSSNQLLILSIRQKISIEDRRKFSGDQLLQFGIRHELTSEEVSRLSPGQQAQYAVIQRRHQSSHCHAV